MFLAVEWCDVVMGFCFHCLLNIGLLQIQITMSMEGIYSFAPLVSLCVTAPFLYFMLRVLPTIFFWQKKEKSVDWGPENLWALLFNWMKWVLFPTYLDFLWGENLAPLKSVANFRVSTTGWRSSSVIPHQLVMLHTRSSEKTQPLNNDDSRKNALKKIRI